VISTSPFTFWERSLQLLRRRNKRANKRRVSYPIVNQSLLVYWSNHLAATRTLWWSLVYLQVIDI